MDYAISKGTPRNRIVSLTFTVASQPNINKKVKKLSNKNCFDVGSSAFTLLNERHYNPIVVSEYIMRVLISPV